MMELSERKQMHEADKQRIKSMRPGDPVTNICAGENNPYRHGFFVQYAEKKHRNRYGISHTSCFAVVSNQKGNSAHFDIDVIYPGHLDRDKCKELFEPVWQKKFGKSVSVQHETAIANEQAI